MPLHEHDCHSLAVLMERKRASELQPGIPSYRRVQIPACRTTWTGAVSIVVPSACATAAALRAHNRECVDQLPCRVAVEAARWHHNPVTSTARLACARITPVNTVHKQHRRCRIANPPARDGCAVVRPPLHDRRKVGVGVSEVRAQRPAKLAHTRARWRCLVVVGALAQLSVCRVGVSASTDASRCCTSSGTSIVAKHVESD